MTQSQISNRRSSIFNRLFDLSTFLPLLHSIAALGIALVVGLLIAAASGGNPLSVLLALAKGAFGSPGAIASTLVKSTPLMLTGLAVAIPFRAGLFNIGGEGQLYIGAMAAVWVGTASSLPWLLHIPATLVSGVAAGAAWGAVPGWLKARRSVHEVINTIMLNYVAIQVTDYLVTGPLRGGDYAARTDYIAATAHLPVLWDVPPTSVSLGLPLALLACAVCFGFLYWTVPGVEIRAVGEGPRASELAGISVSRSLVLSMALSGGLAGLAGAIEVTGLHHTFYAQFSPGYGFDGIAVALLARNHPLGVIPTALLFGALRTADRWLQLGAGVPKDLIVIIQAVAVIAVGAQGAFARLTTRRPQTG